MAALVDHTLLKPEATAADVAAAAAEAAELGVYAVCVSPSMVPHANAAECGWPAVAGFPSGKHLSAIKAQEAALAVASGASEVDMVIDVGAALAGEVDAVRSDIAAVRAAVPGAVLKVIVESAALLTWPASAPWRGVPRRRGRRRGLREDLDRVSSRGGASVPAVALMADTVGGRLGVKASGGIRTAADAVAMLDAGATRLGLSGTRAVLDGLD